MRNITKRTVRSQLLDQSEEVRKNEESKMSLNSTWMNRNMTSLSTEIGELISLRQQ